MKLTPMTAKPTSCEDEMSVIDLGWHHHVPQEFDTQNFEYWLTASTLADRRFVGIFGHDNRAYRVRTPRGKWVVGESKWQGWRWPDVEVIHVCDTYEEAVALARTIVRMST